LHKEYETSSPKIILALLANGFAVWAVSEIFPDRFEIISDPVWSGFVIVGISIGFLNNFIKPILKILSLPFIILTFGVFLIVINGLVLWLIEWVFAELLPSLEIQVLISGGILTYIVLGFTLGIINTFLHWLLKEGKSS
jgi:putative membrane protein